MKLEITNNTGQLQKAVVFGKLHLLSLFPNSREKQLHDCFFDFSTDSGISMELDGSPDPANMKDLLSKIIRNPLYFVNGLKVIHYPIVPIINFMKYTEDANGIFQVSDILEKTQDDYIKLNSYVKIDCIQSIDNNTSLLFVLKPFGKVILTF